MQPDVADALGKHRFDGGCFVFAIQEFQARIGAEIHLGQAVRAGRGPNRPGVSQAFDVAGVVGIIRILKIDLVVFQFIARRDVVWSNDEEPRKKSVGVRFLDEKSATRAGRVPTLPIS